ncbi:MAG: hypothetical protein KDI60_13120 [Xanthomonadales bacterium]|nr:hypothetical protein [Xanthomonadales bacterium]
MSIALLARWALLGTERAASPTLDPELSALALGQDAPRTLLRQAAWSSVCERAARLPVRAPSALPECPDESTPGMGAQAALVLREIIARDDPRLVEECLNLLTRAGRHLEPELLPRLLADARDPLSRERVLAAGGHLARWLAQLNPDWSVATDDDSAAVWREGTLAQRAVWLRAQRQHDPEYAREQLAAVFADEAPAARADLLASLQTGLNPADEAFLERALDDRRKEVRRVAAQLLVRLPDSGLVNRAWSRASGLLAAQAGGWLRKGSLQVQLPSSCDAAMQRDGIDAKPPAGYAGGARSYWLEELLARVPPQRWTLHFEQDAAALWTMSTKHEFADSLQRGWLRAAAAADATDWIAVALSNGAWVRHGHELAQQLAQSVARSAEAEEHIAAQLQLRPQESPELLLEALPRPWSPAFSVRVVDWLRQRWNQLAPRQRDHDMHTALAIAAHALDAGPALDDRHWQAPTDARLPKALTEFLAVHRLRHQFLHSLQQEASTS